MGLIWSELAGRQEAVVVAACYLEVRRDLIEVNQHRRPQWAARPLRRLLLLSLLHVGIFTARVSPLAAFSSRKLSCLGRRLCLDGDRERDDVERALVLLGLRGRGAAEEGAVRVRGGARLVLPTSLC